MLKLINPKNKHHKLYPHIFKNLEGWGYKLKQYPQYKKERPILKNWQIIELIQTLSEDAIKLNMLLRH
jgi:uncharacterized LabA/DUF88 family protein